MALKPGLRIGQSQRLTLTPGLRQSLSVLQMTSQEIDAVIDIELAQNPLLTARSPASTRTGGDYDLALDTVAAPETLATHLIRQIGLMRAPKPIRDAAGYLAHMLDDNGYLSDPRAELADDLGLTTEVVDAALNLLQSCEPTGIGAQTLLECLDLQLQSKQITPDLRQVILENLSDFATADWPALTRKTGLSRDRLHEFAALLQTLDPFPAAGFQQIQAEYLRPEVRVLPEHDGSFSVEPLEGMTPVLAIDDALVRRTQTGSEDASAYLLDQLSRAKGLIRAIQSRAQTVRKVTDQIVASQPRFFTKPDEPLVPLTRQDVAEKLGLHPSTVSRAVAGKSLTCIRGVFPLSFFFTSGLKSLAGQSATSAFAVQAEIRRLVASEPATDPLSDKQITAHLQQSGVDIARRTVAKYRQCLKIPSSFHRRRSKRNL